MIFSFNDDDDDDDDDDGELFYFNCYLAVPKPTLGHC